MARHASVRSTMSEQLDYRNEHLFLNAGMNAGPPDVVGSTPEVSGFSVMWWGPLGSSGGLVMRWDPLDVWGVIWGSGDVVGSTLA